MKKVLALFLAAVILLALAACGSEKTLTVKYIRYSPTPMKGRDSFYLVGEQKEVRPIILNGIPVPNVFKDCTVEDAQVGDGGDFRFTGTEDGGYKIDSSVTLTVKDADGKTHSVKLSEGTVIKLDSDTGELLLPEDQ